MSASKKLTKHDITMLGIRSSFLQASFNYERMQACGFTWAMLPALERYTEMTRKSCLPQ